MRVPKKTRIIIVDDSLLFRELLARGLSTDSSIDVAGTAENPYAAVELIERLQPDVMICDVEMPRMNGIEFIRRLLPQYHMPVIVVSTVREAVLDALQAGAVDFVAKPDISAVSATEQFFYELIHKVKAAAASNLRLNDNGIPVPHSLPDVAYGTKDNLILIGASTGGTEAIRNLLMQLPPNLPGIAVVQHIPPGFSRMFAERLNATTKFAVREARTGDELKRGTVLVAPGDRHMRLVRRGDGFFANCEGGDKINGHCPAVDVLFESAAKQAGKGVIGVLLTGMGYDGAKGLLAIRRHGGRTIGQDADSSVVYGMPKVAYDVGAVEAQLPLDRMAAKICSLLTPPSTIC